MSKKSKKPLVPKLRFPEFQSAEAWAKEKIGTYLKESRIKGSKGDTAKKITVKLWGNGVYEKQEALKGSENTQYFRRKARQFIYSKLDFLNQAFGIIPNHLNNYESTVDLPCFDVSEKLDARFLLEYVQRKVFYKKYGEIADGGRKAKRIQVKMFLEFPIYLPRLPEQEKIAECLTSLDELITAETGKLEAYKAHKKGLMQKLFPAEGKTVPEWRFPEFRDCGEWEERKFSELCRFVRGPFGGALKKDIFVSDGYAVYEQSHAIYSNFNSFRYFITHEKHKELNRFSVLPGDIIMSCSGTMGKFAVIPESFKEGVINQALLKLTVNKGYHLDFIKFTLELPINQEKILSQSAGGAIKNVVGVAQMKEIGLCVPLEKEQKKIADCLTSLDELITAQAKKIDTLKAHKKGLMQGLFPSANEVGV